MKAREKRGEPWEVVSVTYADGRVVPITTDRTLRRILVELEMRAWPKRARIWAAGLTDVDRQRRNERINSEKAELRAKHAKKRVNAQKPRKSTTKKATRPKVLNFIREWEACHPGKRGAIKAASVHFNVSEKRLRQIKA